MFNVSNRFYHLSPLIIDLRKIKDRKTNILCLGVIEIICLLIELQMINFNNNRVISRITFLPIFLTLCFYFYYFYPLFGLSYPYSPSD